MAQEESNGQDLECGHFVNLVWFIEKIRRREGGCTMNDLVIETKKYFQGLSEIKAQRNPCEYCNKVHLEYACDEQIEVFKRNQEESLKNIGTIE